MAINNGSPNAEPKPLDVEHELPAPQEAAKQSSTPEQQGPSAPDTSADAEKLRQERDSLLDRLARVQATYENSRKRAVREQQEVRQSTLAQAIRSMLPVLDSLDRALQATAQSIEEFRFGIELIRRQFEDALAGLGATRIPAKGQAFDPRVHEAIEVVETSSANDNQVLEELQRGYRLGDVLVRPARVRVARNPKNDAQPQAA